MAVGALIVAAGITILWEAYIALRVPHAMEAPWSGMVVNALATFLNITWGGILIWAGGAARLPSLRTAGIC
jgi:divalent metal cation (Fe/Co/Zn/Cd) transporter